MGTIRSVHKVSISLLVVMLLTLGACSDDTSPSTGSRPEDTQPAIEFEYPSEWKATPSEAQSISKFNVLLPSHDAANPENVNEAFVEPGGNVVAFRFTPPHPPSSPVRQDYIEIFEEPWQGGQLSPEESFSQVVKANPESTRLSRIDGVIMMLDSPHSDQTGQDPAFVRFVVNGVDVQISGGDDLDLLIGIAKTMITP